MKGACLEELQLLGNPVCEMEGVKEEVKVIVPQLKSLDEEVL